MKSIKALDALQKKVLFDIVNDPEEAGGKFEKEWKLLGRDDKSDLRPILLNALADIINSKEAGHPQGPKNVSLQKIAASRIKNRLEKEAAGKLILPKMKLADGVGLKDIAAMVRTMFKIRYLNGKLKEYEDFSHNLIDISDTKTFRSYLRDEGQIEENMIAFKGKVNDLIF